MNAQNSQSLCCTQVCCSGCLLTMHLRASHKAQPKYTFPPLESQTEFAPGCRSGQSGGLSVPAVCSNSSPPPRRNPVRCADHVRHDGLGDCRDTQNSPEQWYLIG